MLLRPAGKTAHPPPTGRVLGGLTGEGDEGEEEEEGAQGAGAPGSGAGAVGQIPNPMALFTAMLAAAQAMNPAVKQALQQKQEQQQQGGSGGP